MLRKIIDQVVEGISGREDGGDNVIDRDSALRLATAVLMVDVARADHVFEESEFDRVLGLIQKHFRISPEKAAEITNSASEKAEDMVSLHDFIQLLNQNLDEQEKAQIISMLWKVAYADGELDKYEDSLILKVSDLLYVSRGRVMRLKHDEQVALGIAPD